MFRSDATEITITTTCRQPAFTPTAGTKPERLHDARSSREKQGGGTVPTRFPLPSFKPHPTKDKSPPYLIISSLCPRKNFWLCSRVL